MHRTIRTGIIATGCAAVLTIGAVAPAFASPATPTTTATSTRKTLAEVQQAGAAAIAKRQASLTSALQKVRSAKDAAAGDVSTVTATLTADQSGLAALAGKIQGDTDLATARADVAAIYTTYRVYAVALPQAHIALGADRIASTSIPKLQAAHDALAALGADTAQLAAMQADITAAATATSGLSASALSVTPAQYDTDKTVMSGLRTRLETAVADVRTAVAIGRTLQGTAAKKHAASTATPAPSASANS